MPIDDLVLCRATSVEVRVGSRFSTRFHSHEAAIWMVRRMDLDLRLAEAAVQQGAVMHDGEAVRSVDLGGETSVVSDRGQYSTRVLIGADGAESRVARWLGFSRPLRWMVALEDEVEVAGDPLRGEAIVDLSVPHGYGWVFPKGDRYNVGLGTFDTHHARRLRHLLRDFTDGLALPLARPLAPAGHRIPAGLIPGPLHTGGALLVGDAAGVADPFFAEGISYALMTGRIAAESVVSYLAGESRDLSSYTRRVNGLLGADMRAWRLTAAVVHRFPALSVRLLAAGRLLQPLVESTIAGDVGSARLSAIGSFARPYPVC
jgi:flavin-dependent dehydrogenase